MTPSLNSAMDAGIPVLTEVLDLKLDLSLADEPAPAAAEPPASIATAVPARAEPAAPPARRDLTELEWEALERKLTERVLHGLAERVDFVLEQRLRDGLADALQSALNGLTAELRRGLHQTLDDVVARAVAQEVARMQAHPSLD